ncbi:MAG: putative selenate reductase subunit YgfK [Lachnospiraceae bacterium]|nr:putative selenate reductase subunit YgfK [Lachnospiraceae bacterium]
MSDMMRPISIDALFGWMLSEYKKEGTMFGIRKFYKADAEKSITLFGEKMETPCGPAAGPQTQLTQNIIVSYLTGARFLELKTCQILDGEDLPVNKPCIAVPDECYNVEWSTELRIPKAYEEYVKAWYLLKIFSKELDLGSPDGFIFNMSVGYDLEGIKSEKIDSYITGMQNAENRDIWRECQETALKYLGHFKNVDQAYIEAISPEVSRSITLSTLHGCPPAEIERIATYLLEEKGLNTFIKCNPTLLGYAYARETLNKLGFDYMVFDDHHFNNDLQFEDAVPMLQRLQVLADQSGLNFGVKITNTFPVKITADELPGEEMYMSGRALFPLSMSVAKRLSDAFDGKLQISYSGGADVFNIEEIFAAGIWPITMATTLLKTGGYGRMHQLAELLTKMDYPQTVKVDLDKVNLLLDSLDSSELYIKAIKIDVNTNINKTVPLTDCYTAPCREEGGCPISQDIPAYLRYVSEENYEAALNVIVDKNPLPFITGTLCAHPCMTKCMRQHYEKPIEIRQAKLIAAEKAYDQILATVKASSKMSTSKTAVVGGGPAGIAAAYLLAREGQAVTVFEKADVLGGVVAQVVPEFRIPIESVQKDVALAKAYGAKFIIGKEAPSLVELGAQGYDNVIYAIGAWKPGQLRLEAGTALHALEFLKANRENTKVNPYGKQVIIVGGGNTAMDCARAAVRLPDVEQVSVVYRRDKRNMPADEEELYEALSDGVVFLELLAPVKLVDGILTCEKMQLGARDSSGRRKPEPTGEFVTVKADTVIAAVGEKVDSEFYQSLGIACNQWGMVDSNPGTLETNLKHVYVIGDANLGPATIVEAIADATKAVNHICAIHNTNYETKNQNDDVAVVRGKRGILYRSNDCNPEQCLECSTVCESCMDVCPNRANVVVYAAGKPQILHIDRMCNECGNCEVFCPYTSAPYKDKFTLFINKEDFYDSTNQGFYVSDVEKKVCLLRLGDVEKTIHLAEQNDMNPDLIAVMNAVMADYKYFLTM